MPDRGIDMFKIILWHTISGIITFSSVVISVAVLEMFSGICKKKFIQLRNSATLRCLLVWMFSFVLIVGFTFAGLNWH